MRAKGLFGWMAVAAVVAAANVTFAETSTPPTVVDAWDVKSDLAKIEQQFASIAAVLENEAYFTVRNDEVSGWSCGQQAGHLALALSGTADSIENLLANPDTNADGAISVMGVSVLESGVIPRGVGQAPEEINPGDTSREALLAALDDAKTKWAALAGKVDAIESCTGRAPHPTGMLKASDWVRLMSVHNAHHLKIVRDILAASGESATGLGEELTD